MIDSLSKSESKNINIIYNSVELHPITPDRMALILDSFKEKAGQFINLLINEYKTIDISKPGLHQLKLKLSFGNIILNLWLGEALEMVNNLTIPCDAWFLDGHGPKKNPLMWRAELLKSIGDKTVTGGTFATFTVAVEVTRALINAGFVPEQFPGFGRKRAVLKGKKR